MTRNGLLVLFTFVFLYPPYVFCDRWSIPHNKNQNFFQDFEDVDLTSMLLDNAEPLSDSVVEQGAETLDELTSNLVDRMDETYLVSFKVLFNRLAYLMPKQKVAFVKDSLFVLKAFARKPIKLDCDTACFTWMVTLYKLQEKYRSYDILNHIFLVFVVDHVLMAVELQDGAICYFDTNQTLQKNKKLKFYTKKKYLLAAKGDYDHEPFVLVQGKQLACLPLAATAVYYSQKEEYELAQAYFEAALELHPECTNAWVNMAIISFLMDKPADTIAWYEKAKKLNLGAQDYYYWDYAYSLLEGE